MTDEKKPPQEAALANGPRWATAHIPDGAVTLTVYEAGGASAVVLSSAEAAYLAMTLLADGSDNFDADAASQRMAALASQVVTHRHDDLRPGELSVSHDVVGDLGRVILDRVADRGRINGHLC